MRTSGPQSPIKWGDTNSTQTLTTATQPPAHVFSRAIPTKRIAFVHQRASALAHLFEWPRPAAPAWVLADYPNLSALAEDMKHAAPAVVLLEVPFSFGTAVDRAQCLLAICSRAPVLCITQEKHFDSAAVVLRAGACGCLLYPVNPPEIFEAVHRAIRNEVVLCARAQALVLQYLRNSAKLESWSQRLSFRECQVAQGVLKGLQNKEISDALGISTYTVNAHLQRIFKKLNVSSRFELRARCLGER